MGVRIKDLLNVATNTPESPCIFPVPVCMTSSRANCFSSAADSQTERIVRGTGNGVSVSCLTWPIFDEYYLDLESLYAK